MEILDTLQESSWQENMPPVWARRAALWDLGEADADAEFLASLTAGQALATQILSVSGKKSRVGSFCHSFRKR